MQPKLIGLVRVSTDMQDESGLGQKAQMAAIERYRDSVGGTLVRVYQEVESGKHDDIAKRPEFRKAISHAQRSKSLLVIGKLDRLVRSTIAMSYLKQSKVRFVACDNPFANELTIDILTAVAADEARKISIRTSEALTQYKAHAMTPKRLRKLYPEGVPADLAEPVRGKLGASLPQCRNLTPEARLKGAQVAAELARQLAVSAYADIAPWMAELRAEGLTLEQIAQKLNDEGHTTRRGMAWNKMQVLRVLDRCPAPAGAA